MAGWIKYFAERWNDWCGDRDMELTIRRHLSQNGYFGDTAKLRGVRLVAVQRPGWLQVFRFDVTARVRPESEDDDSFSGPAEYQELYGLVRDDIRHKINSVRVFQNESERRALFATWSEDMICLRGAHGLQQS
tara:strand:+ start:595877 stop:596275 length:399 start_codon:yes stop_codon:yes gene_type:complete